MQLTAPVGESSVTRDEAVGILRNWLNANPQMKFKQARADARKLNIRVTARMFSEACKNLGITAATPPRPPVRRSEPAAEESDSMNDNASAPAKTSVLTIAVEYMRSHPDAPYAEIAAACKEQGYKMAPIIYGNARKALGLPKQTKRPPRAAAAAPRTAPPRKMLQAKPGATPTSRRAGASDITSMLSDLHKVVADRDRYYDALQQIAQVLRDTL